MNYQFLIVVDAQNDFITGELGSEEAQKAVPKIVKKIFTHFGPIIATADTHSGSEYLNTFEGKNLPVLHCVEDSEGWKIQKDILAAMFVHGDYLGYVKKNTFGSFDLVDVINNYIKSKKTIDNNNLVAPADMKPEFTLVGFCTDICVISNALILRAAFPESKITIVKNCCAGTTIGRHRDALNVAKSCQIDVV